MGRGKHNKATPKMGDPVACSTCFDRYIESNGEYNADSDKSFEFSFNDTTYKMLTFIKLYKNLRDHYQTWNNKGDSAHDLETDKPLYYSLDVAGQPIKIDNNVTKQQTLQRWTLSKSHRSTASSLSQMKSQIAKPTSNFTMLNLNQYGKRKLTEIWEKAPDTPSAKRGKIENKHQLSLKEAFDAQTELILKHIANDKHDYMTYCEQLNTIIKKNANGIELNDCETKILLLETAKDNLSIKTIDDIEYKFGKHGMKIESLVFSNSNEIESCFRNQLSRYYDNLSDLPTDQGTLHASMLYCVCCNETQDPFNHASWKNVIVLVPDMMNDKYSKGLVLRDCYRHIDSILHDSKCKKTKLERIKDVMSAQYGIVYDIIERGQPFHHYTSECAGHASVSNEKGHDGVGTAGHSEYTINSYVKDMYQVHLNIYKKELHTKLPSTNSYPHFSTSRDGVTQQGYGYEHFTARWMSSDGIFRFHSCSMHHTPMTDGLSLAEKTLIPLYNLSVTSNHYNIYCTGEDGDGATRVKRVTEKFEDMIGNKNKFKVISEDLCHLYSGNIKFMRCQFEPVKSFTDEMILFQGKFGDERSMINKDLESIVPDYKRFKQHVDSHFSSHEQASIESYQHNAGGILYLCEMLSNENSEIKKLYEINKTVGHHYFGFIHQIGCSILSVPTKYDQSFSYICWKTVDDCEMALHKARQMRDEMKQDMTNTKTLFPSKLTNEFKSMSETLIIKDGNIIYQCMINDVNYKDLKSTNEYEKRRNSMHKNFMNRTKNATKLSTISSDKIKAHDLLLASTASTQSKSKQLKSKQSTQSKSKHSKKSKPKNTKQNDLRILFNYNHQSRKTGLKSNKKSQSKSLNNVKMYQYVLKLSYIPTLTNDYCYICNLSHNYEGMVGCSACKRLTHVSCGVDADDNDTTYDIYKQDKSLIYHCPDCKKLESPDTLDKPKTTKYEWASLDECILWLKYRGYQYFYLLVDSIDSFIKTKIPQLFFTMRNAFSLSLKQESHQSYLKNKITLQDVSNHGIDAFRKLVILHNEDQPQNQKELNQIEKAFQRWNLLVFKLNTELFDATKNITLLEASFMEFEKIQRRLNYDWFEENELMRLTHTKYYNYGNLHLQDFCFIYEKSNSSRSPESNDERRFRSANYMSNGSARMKPTKKNLLVVVKDGIRNYQGPKSELISLYVEEHLQNKQVRGRIMSKDALFKNGILISKAIDNYNKKHSNKGIQEEILIANNDDKYNIDINNMLLSLDLVENKNDTSHKDQNKCDNETNNKNKEDDGSDNNNMNANDGNKDKINDKIENDNKKQIDQNGENDESDKKNQSHDSSESDDVCTYPTRCLRKRNKYTCFMNSTIQFLSNIRGIVDICYKHMNKDEIIQLNEFRRDNEFEKSEHSILYNETLDPILEAIIDCSEGNNNIDMTYYGENIGSIAESGNHTGYELKNRSQNDVCELIQLITNYDSFMSYKSQQILKIKLVQTRQCHSENCDNIHNNSINTLWLKPKVELFEQISVQDIMNNDQKEYIIDDFICDKCFSKGCSCQIIIEPLSDEILIQLPRWKTTILGTSIKNDSAVKLSEELTINETTWKLQGLIEHNGLSATQGHYTTTIQAFDSIWKLNDQFQTDIKQFPTMSKHAYLLHYRKI